MDCQQITTTIKVIQAYFKTVVIKVVGEVARIQSELFNFQVKSNFVDFRSKITLIAAIIIITTTRIKAAQVQVAVHSPTKVIRSLVNLANL